MRSIRQQLHPAAPRSGAIVALPAQLTLEKQQLGVIGTADLAGLAHRPRLLVLAQAAMAQRQQREQLERDGIGRMRLPQAALQQRDGLGGAAQVGKRPAEVEQREGVVGTLGQIEMQQPQVAFELLEAQGRIDIAAVVDGDVGEADGMSGPAQAGQNLSVTDSNRPCAS